MKGDSLSVATLIVVGGLVLQAVDAPVMLWIIEALASWLRALPTPEEHFAVMLGKLAWPAAALLIAWWLRDHIQSAAGALARRFEDDNVELGGGFLKVSRGSTTSLATLDVRAAAVTPEAPEAEDAKVIEGLLEYAGDSDARADELTYWIATRFGPKLDPEEFLNEDRFAEARKDAYAELVEGLGHD